MTFAARNGVTVEISEVNIIKLKGKSKVGKSALSGALILGSVGFAAGFLTVMSNEWGSDDSPLFWGIIWGGMLAGAGIGAGAIIGAIHGASKSRHKTFHVKGKSPDEIKNILKKLWKKARFKD